MIESGLMIEFKELFSKYFREGQLTQDDTVAMASVIIKEMRRHASPQIVIQALLNLLNSIEYHINVCPSCSRIPWAPYDQDILEFTYYPPQLDEQPLGHDQVALEPEEQAVFEKMMEEWHNEEPPDEKETH